MKAADFAPVLCQPFLVDPGFRHLCIRHYGCAVSKGVQCTFYHIVRKHKIIRIVEIRACMDTTLYNRLCAREQLLVPQFFRDDLKASLSLYQQAVPAPVHLTYPSLLSLPI